MIIIDETTLGFKIPEEYQYAIDFEKEHPNWKRTNTTQMISFTHKGYYDTPLNNREEILANIKKEGDDESISSSK